MHAMNRWNFVWPLTRLFLVFYIFGMRIKHMSWKNPFKYLLYVPGVFSAVLSSVVYNWTLYSFILMELPRTGFSVKYFSEWMTTQRTQRLYDENNSCQRKMEVVTKIVEILNKHDENHIKKEKK